MAKETEPEETELDDPTQDGADGEEPDYKALYEKALKSSRRWETRSKANLKELNELKSAAPKADPTVEERLGALESENAALKASAARSALVDSVAKATGLDRATVAMLNGSDEDALTEQANALAAAMLQSTRPRGAQRDTVSTALAVIQGYNPRAREGRDMLRWPTLVACRMFQPTRPRGARQWGVAAATPIPSFQPTRPRGARLPLHRRRRVGGPVSTHAPARGATYRDIKGDIQSTVSTHAPARGATRSRGRRHQPGLVSTHAPARGATQRGQRGSARGLFQPTRPRGARRAARRGAGRGHMVSTHAPARGATLAAALHSATRQFQPTRPRGARPPLSRQPPPCSR